VTYQALWRSELLRHAVDAEQWQLTDSLLQHQLDNAREWRSVCLDYFMTLRVN
jgi:alpha-glucuronidase